MKSLTIQHIVILMPVMVLLATVLALILTSRLGCDRFCAETFSESNEPLQNPYCGFYHIIGYTLSDGYIPSDNYINTIDSYADSLALLEINLKNYRESEISEKGLSQLNDILAAWENSPHKTKLILRFLYDWDGIALATEPDSLELILKHMEQVSPAVNRYHETVYIMQGVFIGNWGEMHHSKFADNNSVKILINRLCEPIVPSVYLSVRTPSLWRTVTGLHKPPEKLYQFRQDSSLKFRLGLFNDGILGSESDLGTYGNALINDADFPSYSDIRKEELKFQNELCRFVPNGGEVVYNNNLSKLETAVSALKTRHISYLNADYDSRVLKKWKNSVWAGNDTFHGCDGYSYVKAHLGYRYVIKNCNIKKSGVISDNYTLRLTIENVGFSNALIPFETSVTLINKETGNSTIIPIDADFRRIESGNTRCVTATLPLKELQLGEYLVYFSVKEKSSGQTVLLGNKNENTKDGYLLGRLKK